MIILSHQQAKTGDEVIAVSSAGSFTTIPQIAGGLGPWVIRSPRVPSTWYITESIIPAVVTQSTTSSTTNITTLGTTSFGFDVSCEARLSSALDETVAGAACYGAIRFDCISSYIEIGRYKTSVGQSIGIRSNIAGIQSLFGDIISNASAFTIRMAKFGKTFLLQCAGQSLTIDTTGTSFGAGSILLVSYADSTFNTSFSTSYSSIDMSPAVIIGTEFAESSVINGRVAFTMPELNYGIYQVTVSGFEIEDSTTIISDNSRPRALPSGRGTNGTILGDSEVR